MHAKHLTTQKRVEFCLSEFTFYRGLQKTKDNGKPLTNEELWIKYNEGETDFFFKGGHGSSLWGHDAWTKWKMLTEDHTKAG